MTHQHYRRFTYNLRRHVTITLQKYNFLMIFKQNSDIILMFRTFLFVPLGLYIGRIDIIPTQPVP